MSEEIEKRAKNIVSRFGSYYPDLDLDEPNCNIVFNERHVYKDEKFTITKIETITVMDSVYSCSSIYINHNGLRVFEISYENERPKHFLYNPGNWEKELDKLYENC